MNNRKQIINSILNSMTLKEFDEYINDNNINKSKVNKEILEKINKIKEHKPVSHSIKVNEEFNDLINQGVEGLYKSGQAWVIAFVLECFYDDKYKISDLQQYMKILMKNDEKLKNMVYEIMKDF